MEWKTIIGFENYEVSDTGEVRNKETGQIKAQQINKQGYCRVSLNKGGVKTKVVVHRLVAQNFLENPHNLPCINHKDEDKTNNRVDNLEWCTVWYNNHYGSRQKRCDYWRGKSVVAYKDGIEVATFTSIKNASLFVGVSMWCIRAAANGEQRTAGGYEWRYKTGNTNKADHTQKKG